MVPETRLHLLVLLLFLLHVRISQQNIMIQCACDDYMPCHNLLKPRTFKTCLRACKKYPGVSESEVPSNYEQCLLEFNHPISKMIQCSFEEVLLGCGNSRFVNVVEDRSLTELYNMTIQRLSTITTRVGVGFDFKTLSLHTYHRCLFNCIYPVENKCTRKFGHPFRCGLLLPESEAMLEKMTKCAFKTDITRGILLEIGHCMREVVNVAEEETDDPEKSASNEEDQDKQKAAIEAEKKELDFLWRHWGQEEKIEGLKKEAQAIEKLTKQGKMMADKNKKDDSPDSEGDSNEKSLASGSKENSGQEKPSKSKEKEEKEKKKEKADQPDKARHGKQKMATRKDRTRLSQRFQKNEEDEDTSENKKMQKKPEVGEEVSENSEENGNKPPEKEEDAFVEDFQPQEQDNGPPAGNDLAKDENIDRKMVRAVNGTASVNTPIQQKHREEAEEPQNPKPKDSERRITQSVRQPTSATIRKTGPPARAPPRPPKKEQRQQEDSSPTSSEEEIDEQTDYWFRQ